MPKGFIGSYSLLSFDSKIAQFLVHSQSQKVLRKAVKAWVSTAENIIPVWSGMSRGTLVKLAGQVGVNVSLFVAPGAQPPKGPGDQSQEGISKSTGRLIIIPGRYGFEYSSQVFHLAVNENVDARQYGFRLQKPGPYHFREAADKAFNAEMEKGLRGIKWRLLIGKAFKVKNQRMG